MSTSEFLRRKGDSAPAIFLILLFGSFGSVFAQPGALDYFIRMPMPKVDAPIVVPPITMRDEEGLIAFRHNHPGFLSLNKFDTRIFRFATDSAGKVSRVDSYDRMIYGEVLTAQWVAVPDDGGARIVELIDGSPATIAMIREVPNQLVVHSGEWQRTYTDVGPNAFSLEEEINADGRKSRWRIRGDKTETLVDDRIRCQGELAWADADSCMYGEVAVLETGKDAMYEMMVWRSQNEYRATLGAVEPLGDLYVAGIRDLVNGGKNALFNLAFIDSIMRSEGRITPLLVFLHLGKI